MKRDVFYGKLNSILDECAGENMPEGSKRRPFLAYSWKKYSNKNNLNLVEISRFNDIKEALLNHNKWDAYLGLMFHRKEEYL